MTREQLAEAYELAPEACVERLESLGVPHDVAILLQSWHEETSLLEQYERLMRKRDLSG
jgi:hypothetical protein